MSLPAVLKALALTSVPQCEQKGSHNSEKWACVDSGGVGFFLSFSPRIGVKLDGSTISPNSAKYAGILQNCDSPVLGHYPPLCVLASR